MANLPTLESRVTALEMAVERLLLKNNAIVNVGTLGHIDHGVDTVEVPVETPLELAKMFHDYYEDLAPKYGYKTRPETRVFDPESANGKLMIAVCELIQAHRGE